MDVTVRLEAWVLREFPRGTAERVLDSLRGLTADEIYWQGATERIAAAIVLPCDGRWDWFEAQVELARVDWRDALVNGGVANEDWPKVLDERLG